MISNEFSNKLVHKWRSEEAAIMVGTHTAFYDDPSLTTRLWPGRDPERIVIDKNLSLPAQLHLFDKTLPTIIVNKTRQGNDGNNMYVKVDDNEKFIQSVLNILYQRNIQSLIVEGGAILIQSFIDAGIWDEARVITNKILLIENGIEAPVLKNNIPVNKEQLFSDEICFYRNETK
jgi:diaminohydroxyphosphoribosylaminopyrimidine deaminase/5-amino-6-(5-phosphoribosylamino)uracil reductase